MSAARPILAVGASNGIAARLIADRGLGLASSSPSVIGDQILRWLSEKKETGKVKGFSLSAVSDYSRAHQVERLSSFLCSLVDRG